MLSMFKNWDADRWISLSAALIALSSLGLSMCQGNLARIHNRVSVRPLVIIDNGINETGIGWRMGNYGLGPALIEWFKVSVDGENIHFWSNLNKRFNLSGTNYKFSNPVKKSVIKPSDNYNLFWVSLEEDMKNLVKNMNRVSISLCYCDLYGQCWLASSGQDTEPYANCIDPPKIPFHPRRPES